jgi:seryl-tRNA synthetase
MQQEVIQTYRDLMTELGTLPAEIAEAKLAVSTCKATLAESEAAMKTIEEMIVPEGSNAELRKLDVAKKLAASPRFHVLTGDAKKQRFALEVATINADKLERQFAAVGFAARLHAGLMAYMAAAGSIPPVDISFGMGKPVNGAAKANGFNGNGATVTATDAAAVLGL